MGLLELLAGFSSEVATTKTSLRPLLSSRNVWKPDQEIAFVEVKVLSRVEGASNAGLFQPHPRHSAPGDRSRKHGMGLRPPPESCVEARRPKFAVVH